MSSPAPPVDRSPAPPSAPRGRVVVVALGLAALGLIAVALLSLRLALLAPLTYGMDDPALHADGFYPSETSADGARFRWSRPSAGFLVPALAARQAYKLEVSAPRPAGAPAPAGIRLMANGASAPIAGPGWTAVGLRAASQVGLENALAITAVSADDSFYPPGDGRLLTAAVRGVSMAPAAGPGGWPWPLPAPLPAAVALLAPAGAFWLTRRRGARAAWAAAALMTALVGGLALALPAGALPAALGALGAVVAVACAVAALLRGGAAWERGLAAALAGRGGRAAEALGLTGLYATLALAATWPLATRIGEALPGWPGDNFAFLYKIWWVRTALQRGADLFRDPNVFYPFGFNFGRGEPTLPNTIPGALLAMVGGDAFGYNVVLLAGFVLSGLGAYALARAVGAGRGGALLAGALFMLAPYRLAQAAGHLQIAATQWIPWTLWAAERALRGSRRHAALAGLFFGLTALTAWYYAIIGGLLLAGYVALRLWQARPAREQVMARGRAALGSALAFGLVAAALILPGLIPALSAAGEAPLTHSAKAADENSASLADYVIPNELQPLWGRAAMEAHRDQNIIENPLYVGLPAALLAGVALWRGPRRPRGAWIWAALGAGCLLLSLGLTLRILPGDAVTLGGATIPLPARLLYEWVPGFNSLRAYARFAVGVALAVAVLAALGAERLRAWPRLARVRAALLPLLLAAALLDFWTAPNAWGVTRVAPDAVAGFLAAQPEPGAVMRLPLTAAIAGPPLYAGVGYGRPLAYGYETFEPPGFAAARPTLARFPSAAGFSLLRQWDVRFVVVAASSYGRAWAETRRYFDSLPDWAPVYRGLQPRVYDAPFWVGDVRPDLLAALAPDEMVVYRLR